MSAYHTIMSVMSYYIVMSAYRTIMSVMGTKQNLYIQICHKIPLKRLEILKLLIKTLYEGLPYQVARIMLPNKHNNNSNEPLQTRHVCLLKS